MRTITLFAILSMKNFLVISFFLLNFYILPSSISYADECITGDCENYGTYRWSNGDIYKGSFKDHVVHGQGTYNWALGDKYVGEWKDGFIHGQGTLIFSNGDKYVGKFKESGTEFNGTVYYANGDEFVGKTRNSERLEGTFTSFEEKQILAEKQQAAEKKSNIKKFKSDCEDIGFTDGTEAMGNCILKLMELENNSAPQVVTTNESSSNDNAMMEIERAKLKAEQERLEVEKQRAWIERQEQLNRIGTQSIDQGWCLMNGGGWGC